MYKLISILFISLFLLSCGGDSTTTSHEDSAEDSKFDAGKEVYFSSCVVCHQASGEGVEGAFPPLANSDYLLEDKFRAIDIAANGMEGEITVNGVDYNTMMASQSLTKKQVKDVVNYILNAWGNDGGEVTMQEVQDVLTDK